MKIIRTYTKSGQHRPTVKSDRPIYSVIRYDTCAELGYTTKDNESFAIQFTNDDALDLIINALTELKNNKW